MRILNGKTEIETTTPLEQLLVAALKALLIEKGDPPSLKGYRKEFKLPRFSFTLAMHHYSGTVEVSEDGNNGQDMIRLKE